MIPEGAVVRPKPIKPLGRPAYGSTPHLPGSRVGAGDWHLHEGQALILCERARDALDRIVVSEKLDGSCVAVARVDGAAVALTRAGYRAEDSHFEQHHHFARWVAARRKRLLGMLAEGERVPGEWLLQAHGIRYELASPEELFVPFDVFSPGRGKHRPDGRIMRRELDERCGNAGLRPAALISSGPPLSVEAALGLLGDRGAHGATEAPEGAVWRCERQGAVEFLAKFVRHDKADGKLLPEVSGGEPVWNWPPEDI